MIFNENSIHKSILYKLFLLSHIFVSIALNFNITFKVHFNNNLYKYLLQLEKKMKNILFSLSSFITQIYFIIYSFVKKIKIYLRTHQKIN